MGNENIKKIYDLLNSIPVTPENEQVIEEIKDCLLNGDFQTAVEKLRELQLEKVEKEQEAQMEEEDKSSVYPEKLSDPDLEEIYIGLLINDPKQIVKFYFPFKECMFENPDILNLYKSVLFTDAGDYASEVAKEGFNFPKETEESYKLKMSLK